MLCIYHDMCDWLFSFLFTSSGHWNLFGACAHEPNFFVLVLQTIGVSGWFANWGIAVVLWLKRLQTFAQVHSFCSSSLQLPTSDAPIVSTPTLIGLFRPSGKLSTVNSAHASATCTWASGTLAYQKCFIYRGERQTILYKPRTRKLPEQLTWAVRRNELHARGACCRVTKHFDKSLPRRNL